MQSYLAEAVTPFHTPGHKFGKGAYESLQQFVGQSALALDLTCVPGLGDLFDKQGPIQESQQQAAQLYGADASYYLINGTTGGIYAMILAAVGPGDKIIVPRNIHRSVMGGLILSGAMPIFVSPAVDPQLQIAMNTTAETYETAMRLHPDAKAVLLLNPTYYGVVTEITKITELAHQRRMLVLVDEAHGPHLHFSTELPLQAISAGADLVVQSTHKILTAMSQASILHCRRERVDVARLESMLQLVQSSSPNYLLLASLESAVAQLIEAGPQLIGRTVALATQAREWINQIDGLYCFGADRVGQPGVAGFDATKLVVTVSGLGIFGNTAEAWLRRHGKVQAELSDINNVLFLVTLADDAASLNQLVTALTLLAAEFSGRGSSVAWPDSPPAEAVTLATMSPRDAAFGRHTTVGFDAAAGQVCGETITSYPPGIPLLFPGERITPATIAYCRAIQRQGFKILGPADPSLLNVEVVA
jgi:lysine decarboxylase